MPSSPGVPLHTKSSSPPQQQQQIHPSQVSFKDVQTSPPDLPPIVPSPPDFRRHFPIMAPLMEERTPPESPAPPIVVNSATTSGNTSGVTSGGENSAPTTTKSTPYATQQSSPVAAATKLPSTTIEPTAAAAVESDSDYTFADHALDDRLTEKRKEDAENDVEGEGRVANEAELEDDDDNEEDDDEDDELEEDCLAEMDRDVASNKMNVLTAIVDTAGTPSDAVYAAGTPSAAADADYAAATPADVATLHLLLEDSSKSKHENQLVGRFISKGCSCTLGPRGQPCYTGFSIEDILKKRNAALALPKNERELIVKAYLLHMRKEPEHNPGYHCKGIALMVKTVYKSIYLLLTCSVFVLPGQVVHF